MSRDDKLLRLIAVQDKILELGKKHQTKLIYMEKRLYSNYYALMEANREYKKELAVLVRHMKSLQGQVVACPDGNLDELVSDRSQD
jgi:hypothetical protein